MTMPRSTAALMTDVREPSSPDGAFPAPNVSRINPRRPGTRKTPSIISGLMPGKMRRHATCAVSRFGMTPKRAMVVGRLMRFQFTSAPMAEIFARGSKFGEAKAENDDAETLVVRFPRYKAWWKNRHTSGMVKVPAMMREPSKLSTASDCKAKIEA